MKDLTKILKDGEEPNEEQLMNYLAGNASEEEQHAVESSMNESPFVSDAVEGLQQLGDPSKLNDYVLQLNKNLHEQLAARKTRKEKREIKDISWGIIAVITILLLCIVGYTVIKMF